MRTQKWRVPRKIHPPAFTIGLNHCRQTSIPVWSPWQTISQILMETSVFASALSFCETGWKLFSQAEKPESTLLASKTSIEYLYGITRYELCTFRSISIWTHLIFDD